MCREMFLVLFLQFYKKFNNSATNLPSLFVMYISFVSSFRYFSLSFSFSFSFLSFFKIKPIVIKCVSTLLVLSTEIGIRLGYICALLD